MKQNPSPLSDDVFNTLKERIIHWKYPPGHRFTEEALVEEFGVSRSPVREALRMLVENGLVDKEPRKGYNVKQPDLREIHELYEVRLALEVYAVEMLAKNGMPMETREKLYATWKKALDAAPHPLANFAEQDEEFHESLVAATNNKSLLQYLHNIDERLHIIRMMDITSSDRLRATCEQHLHILDCIKNNAVDGAREWLTLNIQDGREFVEQAVKAALAKAYLGI